MGYLKPDFESEVEAAYSGLVRAATVLCWSNADVEDVIQETLVRAFKSYASFRGECRFLTWAYSILARVAQDANRRYARPIPAEYATSHPDQLPPVDRAVMLDEEARCVIDAIRSLPERQREALTLHFLRELPYGEIAAALGVSVGTVKATIFAAKKSLRAALARKEIRKAVPNVVS